MMWRRGLALAGIILIAALLAFPLRGIVYQTLILPLAYLLWLLSLLYLSLPQAVWWIVLVLVVVIVLGSSLLPEIRITGKRLVITREGRGNVESLAGAIQKTRRGMYYKWLVANRLGRLAYQLLLQREHGKPRSVFEPLTGEGWDAPPTTQTYLEKGLHGSFAEFPTPNLFAQSRKTPLDLEVGEVVEFLESKLEK